jgi:hypothetical protein
MLSTDPNDSVSVRDCIRLRSVGFAEDRRNRAFPQEASGFAAKSRANAVNGPLPAPRAPVAARTV